MRIAGRKKTGAIALKQLQERLQAAQRTDDCGRRKPGLFVGHFQAVALVLIQRWNGIAGAFALDDQRSGAGVCREVWSQAQYRSASETRNHARDPATQTIVGKVRNGHLKTI